jgi:drug/metabolite transporter (DMT)-like permease
VRTWFRQILGLLIGLIGALILVLVPNGLSGFRPEALLVILASTLYALNINLVKRFLPKMPSALIASGSFLWIGPFCLVYLLTTDLEASLNHPQIATALGSIFLLAMVGTSFAVLLFNSLIQNGGPLFASMVTYIVPIFAIMWGVVDGEIVSIWQLIGVLTVLAGVYLVNKPINDSR